MSCVHLLDIRFAHNGIEQVITPVLLRDEAETILVDCGYPDFLGLLDEAARRHGIPLEAVTKVIVTHQDLDHVGSLAALKRMHPHIEIIAHEIEAPYLAGIKKSLRLAQAEAMLDVLPAEEKPNGQQFIRLLQSLEPAVIDRTVSDGERLPWCGGIDIVHTPGHTPGHLSLYIPASKTLIAGDAVVVEEGRLEIANPQFALDLEAALRSVRRLLDDEIEHIVCYHGGKYTSDAGQGLRDLLSRYEFGS
ncbi:MBL fold metallo-hydrolase [Brevibacillus fluminis]|uniref:MBL fold metallo-hydrolase n=1 Tax=Brevibacillus fluminis TaxID=511487 RepID=UPI003F8B3CC0